MQVTKKHQANTLAEVMVALIILGVVASITVPALRKHTQMEETTTKLKKGLMSLEQLVDAAIIDNGDINNGMDTRWSMNNLFIKYLVPEMQVARDCTDGNLAPCFPGDIKTMSGDPAAISVTSAVVLLDGIAIANSGMDFYIDINGPELPNVDGVDIFHYKFENVGRNEDTNDPGDWRFTAQGYAKQIAEHSWKINYW